MVSSAYMMEQIMERLLAKMDLIHAKMDASLKEIKAEIRANN
jgi:hypothetical protein